MAENFFNHVKTDILHSEVHSNIEDFTAVLDECFHWYNNDDIQEKLKGLTPNEFRHQALNLLFNLQTVSRLLGCPFSGFSAFRPAGTSTAPFRRAGGIAAGLPDPAIARPNSAWGQLLDEAS